MITLPTTCTVPNASAETMEGLRWRTEALSNQRMLREQIESNFPSESIEHEIVGHEEISRLLRLEAGLMQELMELQSELVSSFLERLADTLEPVRELASAVIESVDIADQSQTISNAIASVDDELETKLESTLDAEPEDRHQLIAQLVDLQNKRNLLVGDLCELEEKSDVAQTDAALFLDKDWCWAFLLSTPDSQAFAEPESD